MSLACGAVTCKDRASDRLLSCHGLCGKCFHPKCVNLTGGLADKIQSSESGVYWYCSSCRRFTLSGFASRLLAFEVELRKLGGKLTESMNIYSVLQQSFDALKDFNPDTNHVPRATQTVVPPPSLLTHTSKRITRSGKTSSAQLQDQPLIVLSPLPNSRPTFPPKAPSDNGNNSESPESSVPPIPPKEAPVQIAANILGVLDNSTPSCLPALTLLDSSKSLDRPIHSVSSTLSVTDGTSSRPARTNPQLSQSSLRTVPKNKSIFVTELVPSTSVDDVIEHINKVIGVDVLSHKLKVFKISEGRCSSFKILAPPSLFDVLVSKSSWPVDVFIKEFLPRVRSPGRGGSISAVLNDSPSNPPPPPSQSTIKT